MRASCLWLSLTFLLGGCGGGTSTNPGDTQNDSDAAGASSTLAASGAFNTQGGSATNRGGGGGDPDMGGTTASSSGTSSSGGSASGDTSSPNGGNADGTSEGGGTDGGATSGSGGSASRGGADTGLGGGGGQSEGGASACGDPTVSPFACGDDVAVLVDGQDTGFSRCSVTSTLHRPARSACPNLLTEAEPGSCTEGGSANCRSSEDCGDSGPLALCHAASSAGYCNCAGYCLTDDDCGAGSICQCGTALGTCVDAECTADDDCAEGELCMNSTGNEFRCTKVGELESSNCTAECTGVCGCDGVAYCNECNAAVRGVSVVESRTCIPGDGAVGTQCGTDADCGADLFCCTGSATDPRQCHDYATCFLAP